MNPLTGTQATDDAHVVGRATRTLSIHAKSIGPIIGLEVEVNEEGVLYTLVGNHELFRPGAIIVMTQGETDGLPNATVYGDLLKADRGQIYAEDYYVGEIPALRVDRNSMLWALDVLHRDDLTDPKTVAKRNARLERVRVRLEGSTSPRKQRAAQHAERGQQVADKRKRRNPMATAMVTWGGTVQLDKQLRVALKADLRVSKSRTAIVRLLGATWKTFHDADVELASMLRWWMPGRKRPLNKTQAKRLSERVMNVWHALCTVKAAPFARMPMLAELQGDVFNLAMALTDATRLREGEGMIRSARRLLGRLFVHRVLTQMLVTAGRVRRFDRKMTAKECLAYIRAANVAGRMVHDLGHHLPPDSFLQRLDQRITDAEAAGHDDPFDAEKAYRLLNETLALYVERPAN